MRLAPVAEHLQREEATTMKYASRNQKAVLCSAASAFVLAFATPAFADDENTKTFDIEAQPLSEALLEFFEQGEVNVIAPSSLTRGLTANSVSGELTPEEALRGLIGEADLALRPQPNGSIVLVSNIPDEEEPTPEPFRVAQVDTNEPIREIDAPVPDEDEERVEDTIVVIGSNIRGIAADSSPVLSFSREQIQASGASTAQDFIRTLPQNFSGGASERVTNLPNDRFAGSLSAGGGSSVNLRGLGSGSTLVLLNGHRLAPSGSSGSIADISMIPASAIQRVDILTDGASSIYGSDAVAGVVNFVLLDEYEGLEVSGRYGIATQNSSAEEYRANITGGKTWNDGNGLISYEYFTQDEIGVQDRDFSQNAVPPGNLQPRQERHSVLATVSHNFTPNLETFADLTFSRRESRSDSRALSVGDLFSRESVNESLSAAAGGSWKFSDTWFLDVTGVYGSSLVATETLIGEDAEFETDQEVWTLDVKTSGTLLKVPGGDIKLAVGGHYRTESFERFDVLASEVIREADRDVSAIFGEVFIPIVGEGNAVPGVERLELNISGRYDDYDDFGSTSNPKIGVLWSPYDGLSLRGSYSTSFVPPPIGLQQESSGNAFNTGFVFPLLGITPADPSLANTVLLQVIGIDPDLGPETSRSFTAGFDFDHEWGRQNLSISSTWFDIDFEGRLGETPIPDNRGRLEVANIAFNDPSVFPAGTVIFNPPADELSSIIGNLDLVFQNSPPFLGNASDATIVDFVDTTRNLSRSVVSGIDIGINYGFDTDAGSFSAGLDGTYLIDFEQQAIESTPLVSLTNTLFNPVDLNIRGSLGYSNGGINANLFVNYVDDYKVDSTPGAEAIASWTTVDVNLSYSIPPKDNGGLLQDTVLRFSVINLFDQDPPATPENANFSLARYDPTNASPLGRFVALEFTKKF